MHTSHSLGKKRPSLFMTVSFLQNVQKRGQCETTFHQKKLF